MNNGTSVNIIGGLATLNQFIIVAVVIAASSLLLYTLTFNLRDRVARSLNVLLACVSVVYLGDVAGSIAHNAVSSEIWLRFQWLGIALVPPAYLHLSDALLATTGQPSRGRRKLLIKLAYLVGAAASFLAMFEDHIVSQVTIEATVERMQPGILFLPFTFFFGVFVVIAMVNIGRAYRRCLTVTTRRRMGYLLLSSLSVPVGVFPYIIVDGGALATAHPIVFWISAVMGNCAVGISSVGMAYSVSFFGAPQPDRVVKSRMFQWILRGPLVASLVIGTYVFIRWLGRATDIDTSLWVPAAIVVSLLLPQFVITLMRVPLERRLFYGSADDRADVERLQMLGDRLLTAGDVRQFLESVLAAACDVLHVSSGFMAVMGRTGARVEVQLGSEPMPSEQAALTSVFSGSDHSGTEPQMLALCGLQVLEWDGYWIIPLRAQSESSGLSQSGEILGLLGLHMPVLGGKLAVPLSDMDGDDTVILAADEMHILELLVRRAAVALEDRRLQRQVFQALDTLLPQVDELQRMRAAARYTGADALAAGNLATNPDAAHWVKNALGHFWGGPRLTESPLLKLEVVQHALRENNGNAVKALRTVLRNAIEHIKPAGQRKYTGEWLLYNILEMKFLQGLKVRDVAMRLAVSEADLYRKQRVAIEEVVKAIANMELRVAKTVQSLEG